MFDEYLGGLSEQDRAAVSAVIDAVSGLVPEATEGRSYGVPAFRYKQKPLLGFAANADAISIYPFSPGVLESVADQLSGFSRSKGTVRFTPDRPIPAETLAAIVDGRRREIDGKA